MGTIVDTSKTNQNTNSTIQMLQKNNIHINMYKIMCISVLIMLAVNECSSATLSSHIRKRRNVFADWEWEPILDYHDTDCQDLDINCTSPGDTKVCSGNGPCFCGECLCDPPDMDCPDVRYKGKYCQHPPPELTCPEYDGEPCGGRYRGECKCGKCECKGTWRGKTCGRLP